MSWDKKDPHVVERMSHYIHEKIGSPGFPDPLTIHCLIVINLIYVAGWIIYTAAKIIGALF